MEPTKHDAIDHPLERLIFFSDAVFAIAITLLVIEIHVPVLGMVTTDGQYLSALHALLPSFVGFALSFLVIARFWSGHHSAFNLTARYDPALNKPSIHLLMAIVFMPFATAFMAQNIGNRVPMTFYSLTLLVTALLSYRLIHIATSPHLLRPDANPNDVRLLHQRGLAAILGAATAAVASLTWPDFSVLALLSIPLWQALITWRYERRSAKIPETEA